MNQVNPYLYFNGNCKEAFEFYAELLKGKIVMMMTYAEMPGSENPYTDIKDQIVHARIMLGDSALMGSDSPPQYFEKPQGMSVSLTVDSVEEAERIYKGLEEGANITMALQETFWAHRFAMLADRFGTNWMVNYEKAMG